MKAIYFKNGHLACWLDAPKPQPERGEVLIRIGLAGICGTDRALLEGYAGFEGVPGHEFTGTVESVGEDVDERWTGQRVVVEINDFCGQCGQCRNGRFTHCINRRVLGIRGLDGAFAEYLVVNEKLLHPLPDSISAKQAVFVEPLAAAYRVVQQIADLTAENILVIGAGVLGQLITSALVAEGFTPQVVVRHARQRERLEAQGVQCVTEDQVRARSMDVVIDASGHESGLQLGARAVRAGGALVIKSTYSNEVSIDMSQIVVNEIQLIGSRCGPFDKAIEAMAQGKIDPGSLVEAVYPLESAKDAFNKAMQKGSLKVLLQP